MTSIQERIVEFLELLDFGVVEFRLLGRARASGASGHGWRGPWVRACFLGQGRRRSFFGPRKPG